jgi:non-specific serine/threonine protein kinase
MALSPLLKYIYNHGTEEMIRRGKRIYSSGGASLIDNDPFIEQARFRVRNDQYQNFYTVVVQKYGSPADLSVRCQCPYNMSELCRHKVAALFQLQDLAQSGILQGADIRYDQQHTVLRLRTVSEPMLRVFSKPEIMDAAKDAARSGSATLNTTAADAIEGIVPENDQIFEVRLRQNEERYFDTSCTCDEDRVPLCYHKAVVFLQVLYQKGADFFHGLRNWDEQKARLLSLYGYKLTDDLDGKFAFTYDEHGKPSLRVLDLSIKRLTVPAKPIPEAPRTQVTVAPVAEPESDEKVRLLPAFEKQPGYYPYLAPQVLKALEEPDGTPGKPYLRLDLERTVSAAAFPEADRELISLFRKAQTGEALRYLQRLMPFGGSLSAADPQLSEKLTGDYRLAFWEYLLPKYHRILQLLAPAGEGYLLAEDAPVATGEAVGFSNQRMQVRVSFHPAAKGAVTQKIHWLLNDYELPEQDVSVLNAALFCHQHTLYALASPASVLHVEALLQMPVDGQIAATDWPTYLQETVLHWPAEIELAFEDTLSIRKAPVPPRLRLYLDEREQTLVLRPVAVYGETEIIGGKAAEVRLAEGSKVVLQERDLTIEASFLQQIQSLHSDIIRSADNPVFFVPAAAVLSENWFFRFLETMREQHVELLGLTNLRGLRLNTHKPETQLRISSGIDWFDAQLTLQYGDQQASLNDIKKALAAKQNYVRLPDGTLGLLPEEWREKYGLLLKMGDTRTGKLRLRSTHYGVIEQLLSEVDEDQQLQELRKKQERLQAIASEDYSQLDAPEQLTAALRPYQLTGFQWLVFLYEAGWGGILADDMGLGKTVQALAFYLYLKSRNPAATLLVVCPTTLVYNWEAEVQKFAPHLQVYIHHGPRRKASVSSLSGNDIVITTYGTMRSDIKAFREVPFECVVLDESQAIKNPQSQVAKASLLLQARHRIALSGTPLQNNTFDLYSQLNFLNPGMLGSREFFMNEFATPIDKFGEQGVKRQLRQLTGPFMLRRTKEQVARDLPTKTETILYCEMGPAQRKAYNSWRVVFKDKILGLIDQQGIERSHLHILQGLTRLRQICDATSLVGEVPEEGKPIETHSVKLEELTRELEENTGDHKVLVFSQFIGMLSLIRERLTAAGIPFAYFDGSTTAPDRREAVRRFQEEADCRVFLISLKAGGVGLNLTAAEYVYLIDPWWNPAVEQQAIDRTHRIGQTKPVFAYRMICRDSIEEKMMQLQERKRILAEELIGDDGAILKRLTRDDIAFLLS